MKRTKPHPTLDEWWENAIPPGADATRELRFVIVGMLLSLMISFYFFLNYAASYRKLFCKVVARKNICKVLRVLGFEFKCADEEDCEVCAGDVSRR